MPCLLGINIVDEPSDPAQLEIDCRPVRDGWLVVVLGELDLATAPILESRLRELDLSGYGRLVLDLRELSFVDCAGLSVVVAADGRARRGGAALKVLCGPGPVRRVLALTGLDRRITISSQSGPANPGPDEIAAA